MDGNGGSDMRIFLTIISLLGFITVAQAETRYVVDQIKLPMRTGESTGHAIVRMLPSGMAVELLEQTDSGYSHIRTADGKEGWILTRYLMKMPAARDRLAELEVKLTRYNALAQEKEALTREFSQLENDLSTLKDEFDQLKQTSAQAVAIANENKDLKAQVAAAQQELEDLRQETLEIRSGSSQKWFMLGGGAVLLGVILGLILPGMRRRKKSRWGQY